METSNSTNGLSKKEQDVMDTINKYSKAEYIMDKDSITTLNKQINKINPYCSDDFIIKAKIQSSLLYINDKSLNIIEGIVGPIEQFIIKEKLKHNKMFFSTQQNQKKSTLLKNNILNEGGDMDEENIPVNIINDFLIEKVS